MVARDEDLAFQRYRQTGRAEFLGQVFDQTAPGLLLVACHLARGGESAEDLVQATFVTAIEMAARYDAAQPVFRWLAGILANHARVARRRAQRPIDPARLRAEPSPTPDAEAQAREVADAVARALDELPETYRTVLVLRLLHGLEPIEVAHALGRSPETVRTQLHRGLEKLRAALPGSLAMAALAWVVLHGRGLAAVRAAVLGQVALTAPVAGVAFGGLLMANKLLLAAGCAVLLLGGTAVWWTTGGPRVPGANDAGATAGVTAVAGAAAEAAHGAGSRRVPVADQPASLPTESLLMGRCVAAEASGPLAGCTVALRAFPARDTAPAPAWRDPAPILTGPDGRFRFAVVVPDGYLVDAAVEHPERVPVRAVWERLAAAATADVGDVRLPLGVRVRGQVVDEAGQAVANAGLSIELTPLPLGSQRGQHTSASARAKEDGRFDLGVVPKGEHVLRLLGAEHQLVSPTTLALPGIPRLVEQRVVVRGSPCVSGTVVDPAGAPIAGISVSDAPERDHVAAHTDARGEFRLYARDAGSKPVRLRFVQFPTELKPLSIEPKGQLPWGTRGIRVVLLRPDPQDGSGARLRVLDAVTGAAVEEFGYFCKPDQTRVRGGYSSAWERQQMPRRHERGVVELTDLHPSPHLAVIHPADPPFLTGGPVFFEVRRGEVAEVVVRLRQATGFRVQVVRRDGSAVAGTEVELLHAFGPKPPSLTTRAMPMDSPRGVKGPEDLAYLRDKATTAPDGVATLRAPAGETGMTVRVLPVECAGLVVRDVATPQFQAEPLRVVVDTGATLRGRVVPTDVVSRMAWREPLAPPHERRAGLTLVPQSGDARQSLPAFGDCFPVADDGSFRITGVPTGSWSVHLFWFAPSIEGTTGSHSFVPPLATVSVSEGQVVTLDLDASAFRPASVRGVILEAGEPLADMTWGLFTQIGELGPLSIGGPPTDAEGRFRSDQVMPGRYVLAVRPGKRGLSSRQWRQILEPLEVGPGDSVERTFHVAPTTSLVLQLTAADGTPAADCTLHWLAMLGRGMAFSGTVTTDATGTARIDRVPALPIGFHREADDAERQLPGEEQQRRTLLGTVERAPGQTELRAKLRLPAK